MVKIVKITTQKNNKERFNVFIDRGNGEEFGFSVDQDVLIEFQLKKGQTFTESELTAIFYKDDIKKAFNIALKYLSYRMRSKKEINDFLLGKEYSQAVAEEVIKKLEEYNFVNDIEFAKSFVRARMRNSSKGPLLIKREILQKGITEVIAEIGLQEYTQNDQLAVAQKAVEKAAVQQKQMSEFQLKQKIGQALLSKGFTQDIVAEAMAKTSFAKDEEERLEAVMNQGYKAWRKYSKKYEGWELEQKIKQYLFQRGFKTEDINIFIEQLNSDHQ
ncbi:recombination regulator RecX [Bacillus sp. Marseille-P3661]|uniref:recombination regulator RecX n=1 Tax=Bacillus sp. Marseille-P3661 TaxID=1936234 RepID=UPI000C84364C|nr:recombination regulator RecX [Bacillus sp. Marseille-P3661]